MEHRVLKAVVRALGALSLVCALGAQSPPPAWAEETLKQMTLEEKVGQILQIRVFADYTPERAAEKQYTQSLIQRYHIGSLDIGGRQNGANLEKPTPEQVAAVTNDFQRASKLPLLIGADLERGLASRFSGVPDFPFPMAFGAAKDPNAVEKEAAITAREARAVGIHWTFGPVADLSSNPLNPIINTRSFGENAAASASMVTAYVEGAHASEKDFMLVAAKHFPGEGDTASDPQDWSEHLLRSHTRKIHDLRAHTCWKR